MVAWRGWHLALLGRIPEGAEEVRRAVEMARRTGNVGSLAVVEANSAQVAELGGEGPTALARARQAVQLAERGGIVGPLGLAYTALGAACVLEEQWEDAINALERAVERGPGYTPMTTYPAMARAWLGRGDEHRARSAAEEAIAATGRSGARLMETEAQISLAQVLLQSEGASARREVERALSRARALAEEIGYRLAFPRIHIERATLMLALGDEAAHQRELREAHRLFTEMGATGHAERLARELGLGSPFGL
jgi:tetratricopeptide (TPR) repeat protein